MNNVVVRNTKENSRGAECFVDGNRIPLVRSIDFHIEPDRVPVFVLETVGRPDICINGQVEFRFEPNNISDACLIISKELKRHGDFYDGFVASVTSALDNCLGAAFSDEAIDEVAECVVKRISGEVEDVYGIN